MRHIVWCAAFAVLTVSCANTGTHEGLEYGERVSGGSAEERACANTALAELPSAIRDVAGRIRITDNCSGFTSRFIVGFRHPGGPLCVREGRVGRTVVWHEAAHTHFHTLSGDAQEQWEEFFDEDLFHWEGLCIAIPGFYPSHGIITSYGGTNARENYAEWVTWLMHYLRGYGTGYGRVDLSTIDRNDPYYPPILEFFRDRDVITEEEFARVIPLFYDHSR